MRTTLDIDEDVLVAVKELASQDGVSAGKMLSRIARAGLLNVRTETAYLALKNGVPVLPSSGDEVIHLKHVQDLMDDEGI